MANVPGLRSCYTKVGRIVYFGRMLDKIRVNREGRLPEEYRVNLGTGFDGRCCTFLGVAYPDVVALAHPGRADADILQEIEARSPRTDDQCNIWNRFMMKVGWRDDRSTVLKTRVVEFNLVGRPIETFFDLIDFDEGRDPVAARAWELRPPTVLVLMGVSGSGKTTIGLKLAHELAWPFHDADDFHPPANVAKMSAGLPLDDNDRAPWLAAIRAAIDATLARGESAVFTCSALKEKYRAEITGSSSQVKFVFLAGDFKMLLERMQNRPGHFMKPEMLQSQFDALEIPREAVQVDVAAAPDEVVRHIRQSFSLGVAESTPRK